MGEEIKDKEKMNKNEEMQAVDEKSLQSVAGGGVVDKIKEMWQRLRMSRKEKKEIESLLSEYRQYHRRDFPTRMLYAGPDYYMREERITSRLSFYADKYPNISELKRFRKNKKV